MRSSNCRQRTYLLCHCARQSLEHIWHDRADKSIVDGDIDFSDFGCALRTVHEVDMLLQAISIVVVS